MTVILTANGLQALPHLEDKHYEVTDKFVHPNSAPSEITHYELDGKHVVHKDFVKPLHS